MKCPFCSYIDNRVIDSRLSKDGGIIRRRRECNECGRRFTTYERVEELLPLVVKKDGRREAFDRNKILTGIKKACEKRPISINHIEKIVERLEHYLQESSEKEVPSSAIGEEIMKEMHDLDPVAYVRFASVYRQFKDIGQFMSELQGLMGEGKSKTPVPQYKENSTGNATRAKEGVGLKERDKKDQGKLFDPS